MHPDYTTPEIVERFFAKVDTSPPGTDCWLWRGAISSTGYGSFVNGEHGLTSHRFVYELLHGPITSSKLLVCHICDNRLCVRPSHLFIGTSRDNVQDMIRKGRRVQGAAHYQNGEANAYAKLTEADVRAIRKLYQEGMLQKAIARLFNVDGSSISRIVRYETWQHV